MVIKWNAKSFEMERVEYRPEHKKVYADTNSFRIGMVNQGRGELYNKCCLCGWNESQPDMSHIIPSKNKGRCGVENIAPLCPNHHREFDRDVLSVEDKLKLFDWMVEAIPRDEDDAIEDDPDLTPDHWAVFRYYSQDRRGIIATAEIMSITPEEVRGLLADLRKKQPSLFPTEKEKHRFGQQNMPRDGYNLCNIDNIDESEIIQKF